MDQDSNRQVPAMNRGLRRSDTYGVFKQRTKPMENRSDTMPPPSPDQPITLKPPTKQPWKRTDIKRKSVPRELPKLKNDNVPGSAMRRALQYEASERIKQLAQPKIRNTDKDVNEYAFSVKPSSLRYVATERMIQLAEPRIRRS